MNAEGADSSTSKARRTRWQSILACGLVLVAAWLPRAFGLDWFVTPDEPAWIGRSAAFYAALVEHRFSDTFQHGHPGVTITWAGTIAFLVHDPALVSDAPAKVFKNWRNVEPYLREQAIEPVTVLATARTAMVLGNVAALGLAFIAAVRLVGLWGALAGFLLIAFDPFQAGLARLLHLDGLASSLMLASLLTFMAALYRDDRREASRPLAPGYLAVSAVVAGLSWLTKSPAFFLAPFIGLLTVIELVSGRLPVRRIEPDRPAAPLMRSSHWIGALLPVSWQLLGWFSLGMLVFVLLWPAMWTDPLGVLQRVFEQAFSYANEGHTSPIFFNGRVFAGDPGVTFYPLTYLWRTTPPVLVGLGLAALAAWRRWSPFDQPNARRTAGALVSFGLLFGVFISLGAKKFDRYLLPAYLPLDLLAGMGWLGIFRASGSAIDRYFHHPTASVFRNFGKALLMLLMVMVIIVQAGLALSNYPYYLSYYNPIMGGSAQAPQVMMLGWGEGLDQVGRYLETRPGAENLVVMAHYPIGCLSYFFTGKVLPLPDTWEGPQAKNLAGVDYLVLYVHQWQRSIPDPAMLTYFASQTPEFTAKINGQAYALVYRLPPR